MVFNDKSVVMEFPLTVAGKNFWQGRRFLTTSEVLADIEKWKYNPNGGFTLSNIICNQLGPQMKQEAWYHKTDIDKFVGDLMDISLTHGLLFVGNLSQRDNYFAVAETAHNTTNITAEIMEALIKKIEEGQG